MPQGSSDNLGPQPVESGGSPPRAPSPRPKISLVVPLYNEEEGVASLLGRCTGALEAVTRDFEVICVDDGSTDRTLQLLKSYREGDPRVKIAVLSRNFGHQAAYTAGLSLARGEVVVMMDGDLQDPPELIGRMYATMAEKQCDVVYGKRVGHSEPWPRQSVVNAFHRVFRQFSRLRGDADVGNFAMFNRKVLDALLRMGEKNRYLPGMRFFVGFRQEPVEYERTAREAGRSKMGLPRLAALAFDAIFSFSNIPIRICLWLGAAGVLLSLGGMLYTLVSKLTGIAPLGWSSLIMSIFFLGSIQMLFLGIIGEYIFRIYREIQDRPLYLLQEFIE
jgi:dolichol-phosphate mannosyltransferase